MVVAVGATDVAVPSPGAAVGTGVAVPDPGAGVGTDVTVPAPEAAVGTGVDPVVVSATHVAVSVSAPLTHLVVPLTVYPELHVGRH